MQGKLSKYFKMSAKSGVFSGEVWKIIDDLRRSLLLPKGEGWDEGKEDRRKQFWHKTVMRLFLSPSPLTLSLGERELRLPLQLQRVSSGRRMSIGEKYG